MVVDANVLIYAVADRSHFHAAAHDWLESALNGAERVGLPWISLMAFQRIITHPRVTTRPLAPETAWSHVTDWLDSDQSWIPTPGVRHRTILGQLLVEGNLHGNLVADAQVAALAVEHGTGICAFDSDFARFPNLRWVHPGRP